MIQQHMDRTQVQRQTATTTATTTTTTTTTQAPSNFSSSAIELMNHMKQLSTSIHSKYSAGGHSNEEKRNPQEQSRHTTDGISEQYNGLENYFVSIDE